jgi:hypothetical protein
MLYTAQVHLDGEDVGARLSEVRNWLEDHNLDPGTFHYRMASKHVRLRLDFMTLTDAAAFAEAFGGMVLGIKEAGQAAD